MTLEQDILDIRAGIKANIFNSEASVSQGIVLRILHALSWPTYNTNIVFPQYPTETRKVDFALCHPAGKPIALIEAKKIDHIIGAERQLFEYAFHNGVPFAILTDGKEWNFFLPSEQGNYNERRVYKLDIVEREISECVARLERYLKYDAVTSGVAINNARNDYRDVSKARQIQTAFPAAWKRLVDEENEMLLDLVADSVENLCGFKPAQDIVAQFLKINCAYHGQSVVQPSPPTPIEPRQTPNNPSALHSHIGASNHQVTLSNSQIKTVYYKSNKIHATAKIEDIKTTVLANSEASKVIQTSLSPKNIAYRGKLLSEGILVEVVNNQNLVFSKDHTFNSPSMAASIISGTSQNGNIYWKPDKP